MTSEANSRTSPLFEIEQCRVGHARLLASLLNLSDAQVTEASRLPSWSRGHVLTHVARQGDSVVRRLRAAIEGRIVGQYAGGPAERNQAIEAGAHRSAPELVADLEASMRYLLSALRRSGIDRCDRLTVPNVQLARW